MKSVSTVTGLVAVTLKQNLLCYPPHTKRSWFKRLCWILYC